MMTRLSSLSLLGMTPPVMKRCVVLMMKLSAKTVYRVLFTRLLLPCDPALVPCHYWSAHSPTEWEERELDSDEVEELGVDSDMERDKDANDEADREEGDYKITFKPIIKKIMNK